MSPNIQDIQDCLQKLSSTVNKLPKTSTLAARPTFTALLALLSLSAAVSPAAIVELLTKWLSRLQMPVVDIIKVRGISFRCSGSAPFERSFT